MTKETQKPTDLRSREIDSVVPIFANRLEEVLDNESSNGSLMAEGQNLLQDVVRYAALVERRLKEQQAKIDRLESLAVTDDLTGIYNRRGFERVLKRALARAKRSGESGALVYVDLNGFKAVNDTYGHKSGDMILHHVAKLLTENIRQTDTVARLGGDEFAVLLTNCDAKGAHERTEKLRRKINNASLGLRISDQEHGAHLLFEEFREVSISASFGEAQYNAHTEMEDLLDDADHAMYRNKKGAVA